MKQKSYIISILVTLWLAACVTTGSNSTDLKQAAEDNTALGNTYLGRGDLELAKMKFEKALEQNPNLPGAHIGYALLLNRLGQPAKAEKHFLKALRAEPKNPEFNNNYGTFLCDQGKLDKAEEYFLQAAADPLYKTPEFAYTNAARCSLKIPDLEKAEGYFGKALQSNPRFPTALLGMAELYNTLDNNRLAYFYFLKYDEYGRHTPETLWLGIRLAHAMGEKNTQASWEMRLRNQFPDSAQAMQLDNTNYLK